MKPAWPWTCLWTLLLLLSSGPSRAAEPLTLKGHKGWVGGLAFGPDGKTLATASADGTVKLWDPAGGDLRDSLDLRAGEVRSLAFAPDGRTLAAGTRYGSVSVWSVAGREQRAVLKGHRADV